MPEEKWEKLADAAFESFKASLKGLVEREDVEAFAREKAKQLAKEAWLAQTATDETVKAEHLSNVEFIKSSIKGKFYQLEIEIAIEAKDTIVRVLNGLGDLIINLVKGGLLAS